MFAQLDQGEVSGPILETIMKIFRIRMNKLMEEVDDDNKR